MKTSAIQACPALGDPMRRRTRGIPGWTGKVLAAAITLLILFSACSPPPPRDAFRAGATRAEVLAAHGPPARKQLLTKSEEPIWGPVEGFWPQVPPGSRVEIWVYSVEGGTIELYFVDGSDRVGGLGFAPEGAVFEGRD